MSYHETRTFDEMTDLVNAAEAMDCLYTIRKERRERESPFVLGPECEPIWIIEIEETHEQTRG